MMSTASNLDQRSGAFQVARAYRVRRPVGQRTHRPSGVVAGVLRKVAFPDDEDVGHVPALQVAVDDAGARVVSHGGAPGVVGGLVGDDAVGWRSEEHTSELQS